MRRDYKGFSSKFLSRVLVELELIIYEFCIIHDVRFRWRKNMDGPLQVHVFSKDVISREMSLSGFPYICVVYFDHQRHHATSCVCVELFGSLSFIFYKRSWLWLIQCKCLIIVVLFSSQSLKYYLQMVPHKNDNGNF